MMTGAIYVHGIDTEASLQIRDIFTVCGHHLAARAGQTATLDPGRITCPVCKAVIAESASNRKARPDL